MSKYLQYLNKNVSVMQTGKMVIGKLIKETENEIEIERKDNKPVKIQKSDITKIEEKKLLVLTDSEIVGTVKTKVEGLAVPDYFAGQDTKDDDKFEIDQIQKQIPKDYDHFKKVEELANQKSDYDFNFYTVDLNQSNKAKVETKPQQQPTENVKAQNDTEMVKKEITIKKVFKLNNEKGEAGMEVKEVSIGKKIDADNLEVKQQPNIQFKTNLHEKSKFKLQGEKQ